MQELRALANIDVNASIASAPVNDVDLKLGVICEVQPCNQRLDKAVKGGLVQPVPLNLTIDSRHALHSPICL